MHKENAREIILELTGISNSSVEACSIASPTPVILASTINRKNMSNCNDNKNLYFGKDCANPKEECKNLYPEPIFFVLCA